MLKLFLIIPLFICMYVITDAQVPTNGLTLWYPFSGTFNDLSGLGNNGYNTGIEFTTDRFNRTNSAIKLNGISDYIYAKTSTSILQTGQIAVSCWFKCSGDIVNNIYDRYVFDYGWLDSSFGFYMYPKGYVTYKLGSNSGQADPSQANYNDAWHHFVMQYDGFKTTCYIDGILKSTIDKSVPISSLPNYLEIGHSISGTANDTFYSGLIDDFRIYNRVLNSTEILALFNESQTLPIGSSNLNIQRNRNQVEILLTTQQELNTAEVVLERSSDENNFAVLSSIKAKGLGSNLYTFTDYVPASGTSFYRVKIVDFDGTFSYSAIKTLKASNNISFNICPNPVSDKLNILFSSPLLLKEIELCNLQGRVLIHKSVGILKKDFDIDVRQISAGIYILKVITESKTLLERIVIQH